MIDVTALKTAIRSRLIADPDVAADTGGVYSLVIPATVTWTRPVIEYGIQAETADSLGYGVDASDIRLRVMAHDRGPAPGVGSMDGCYRALNDADAALTGAPLTVSGQTVVQFRRVSAVPETAPADDDGYLRMSAGLLYRVQVENG